MGILIDIHPYIPNPEECKEDLAEMGKELEKFLMTEITLEAIIGVDLKFNHITDAPKVGIAPYYGIKTYIRERQEYFKGKQRFDLKITINSEIQCRLLFDFIF